MSDDSKGDIAKAVAEVVKAVPVYQDAVQPGAREIGKTLQTVGRTINVALAPVRLVVWGAEQLEEFFATRVAAKMQATPTDQIQTPKVNVAAPAMEGLRFAGDSPDLQELYANLLATAMDKRVASGVLPAFVEIIRQLTSDEAKILRKIGSANEAVPIVHLQTQKPNNRGGRTIASNLSLIGHDAGCEYPTMVQSYLDNLNRLGVIRLFPSMSYYTAPGAYDRLEADPGVLALKAKVEKLVEADATLIFERSGLEITAFGGAFVRICILPYEEGRHATTG